MTHFEKSVSSFQIGLVNCYRLNEEVSGQVILFDVRLIGGKNA